MALGHPRETGMYVRYNCDIHNAKEVKSCRKPLRDALRLDGYDVDMVGSRHGGTMKDYVRIT